ncbi:MAG: flagellar assembly protein H [Scytonematopsis contorta HA4267-MV1]|nr:flagellar assembly protein H [Scytonematopsis contorta HA4267-MV1]
MTKNPFDQFSKQFFEAFLTPLGNVRTSFEVPGESRFIDILFVPFPQPNINPEELGLLSRIAAKPCLLEPYRKAPTLDEVCSCLQKWLFVRANFQRQANRENRLLREDELPELWIIAPTVSKNILNKFGGSLRSDWLDGIYFFVDGLRTAVIAADKLPATPETLLFRIFGKKEVQQQAVSEILALPLDDNLAFQNYPIHSPVSEILALPLDDNRRSITLELLSIWKVSIDVTGEVDTQDEELAMILSQAYEEWKQETERRGMEQGQRLSIENVLKARFGELDKQLVQIIPSVLTLPIEEYTPLLLQLSREELLARFRTQN